MSISAIAADIVYNSTNLAPKQASAVIHILERSKKYDKKFLYLLVTEKVLILPLFSQLLSPMVPELT